MSELHVVGTDVLLWALGGFAEPSEEMPYARFLPVGYVRELKRLALKPRCSNMEVKELAERYDRSYSGAVSAICFRRRNTRLSRWWDEVTA